VNAIEVVDVSKRFRRPPGGVPRRLRNLRTMGPPVETWALRDVSFAVASGETVGLIGSNGSGKSTLLRLIAGLTRPTTGAIAVHHDLSGLLTLGESFQPLLSGEENALTAAILAGLSRKEALTRLDEVVAFAELEGHMDKPLRTFSDGMRLRLAFAVAVHTDPEILLLDEILAVGDMRFQEKCLGRLELLRERGVSILLTSHYMAQVRRLCHRVVWLSKGELRALGDVDDVTGRYEDAMREGQAPEPLPGGGLRLGTREIEITAIRLTDARGRAIRRLAAGTGVTVAIDFVAHRDVTDATFSVGVHAADRGVQCLDLDMASDLEPTAIGGGPGTVELEIDRLDLADGSYHLDVGVYDADWDRTYDHHWQALSFEVSGAGGKAVLAPPRHWKLR
jgi:homopolymeric O-antigen transport system ATP-binding protein